MIYNPFNFNEIIKKSNMIDNLTKDEKLLIKDNYICTVTRVDEHQKDLTTLILAYEKQYLNNKIKDKLYIIGDGPSRDNLTELVKDKKLEKQILFLGKKTNPFIWMKKANVFILSSKFEGFGLVLVEAMVVNTFVISSNCKTGPTEILDNEKCGDLFAVGSVNELSDKLQYALNNDKYRDNKIANATQNLERFNFNESINNLTRLLK